VFEIFKATTFAALLLVGVTYFVRERYSRATILLFLGFALAGVTAVRLAFRAATNALRRRGFNQKHILVIGAGALGQRVIETIDAHRELGFVVSGVLTRKREKIGTAVKGAPVLGHLSELERVLDGQPVEQVHVRPMMEALALRTIDVKFVPDLVQYMTLRGGLEEFGGLPIISLQGGPLEGWNLLAKRVFDVGFAAGALLLSAPVMVLVALLVRLSSRGPVLYRQERMGMDGRTFQMLKFRTMTADAEAEGAAMASADDPRRTVLGLFNVLVGDMSLVGPRPERPVFIEEFKKQIPRYHLRHMVKSGITGWAQINGLRGQTSIAKRIEFDLYYIENWSLMLDLKILLRTALGGFLSKNAY
jgi:Undecaprenyl-phosphate glucose phosphotransferase